MIVRHGEKPEDGVPDPGLDPQGADDPASLTAEGWRRARKLVGFFVDADAPGIATPDRIFACKPDNSSQRPMETVSLLANALWPDAAARAAHFDATHGVDDLDGLIAAAMKTDGVCLVCWEHKRIPLIAGKIPHVPASPSAWPGHRFDVVWIFDAHAQAWAFSQTPQNLLPGDEDRPIKDKGA
jgi:hypothetical protein